MATLGRIVKAGIILLRAKKILIYLIIFTLFLGLYSEGFDRLWTPHLLEGLSFPHYFGLQPVVWFGLMTVVGSILTIGMMELIRRRLERQGPRALILILVLSTTLLSIMLMVFALAKSIPLVVVIWLIIYTLRRVINPIYTIWFNERISSNIRATILSFSEQVDAFGQILGGPPVGFIGRMRGISSGLIASSVLLIPAILVLLPLMRKKYINLLEENEF